MSSRLGALAATLTLTLATGALATIPAGAAHAKTDGKIKVQVSKGPGARITDYGYDVKQPGKAGKLTAAKAAEIFGQDQMTVLRIPVLAAGAHPKPGAVKGGKYKAVRSAAANARAVNPGVKLFASLRLVPGRNSPEFPRWTMTSKGVSPKRYARLLTDYVAYFHRHSLTINVLGVDNERKFNNGRITAARYTSIVGLTTKALQARGIPVPAFVAPEDYAPSPAFLTSLSGKGWRRTAIAGTHYYAVKRAEQHGPLRKFAAIARRHQKPLWDSEFHWNTRTSTYADAVRGLVSAFDQFDVGFTGLTWWAYNPASAGGRLAELQSSLVRSTVQAQPYRTDDQDGSGLGRGTVNTRAFRQGNDLVVWILNDTGRKLTKKQVKASGLNLSGGGAFTQWKVSGKSLKRRDATATGKGPDSVQLSIAPHSITSLRVANAFPA